MANTQANSFPICHYDFLDNYFLPSPLNLEQSFYQHDEYPEIFKPFDSESSNQLSFRTNQTDIPTDEPRSSQFKAEPKPCMKKPIKKEKKVYHTETKNLTKFFGSKLRTYLNSVLSKDELDILKTYNCETIKGLKQLWIRSQSIRDASRQFFQSGKPLIEVMQSTRISDPRCAIRYISSYMRGIENPNSFQTLKTI